MDAAGDLGIHDLLAIHHGRVAAVRPVDEERVGDGPLLHGGDLQRDAASLPQDDGAEAQPAAAPGLSRARAFISPLIWGSGLLYLFYGNWARLGIDEMFSLEGVALVHTAGAFMITAFFFIHVYLTTTGHTVFAHIKAMITGWEEVDDDQPPAAAEQASAHPRRGLSVCAVSRHHEGTKTPRGGFSAGVFVREFVTVGDVGQTANHERR